MLEVCCNGEGGVFAYRAERLQIGIIELEPRVWYRPPRFVEIEDGTAIRLAGKVWPIVASIECFGNWYWNAYTLGVHDGRGPTERHRLADFAIWLRERDLFDCTHGIAGFYEWFNSHDEVSPAEVHGWICDALEERGR